MTMWLVKNARYFAFAFSGHEAARLKRDTPELRYARITNILQMLPGQIEVGKVYER